MAWLLHRNENEKVRSSDFHFSFWIDCRGSNWFQRQSSTDLSYLMTFVEPKHYSAPIFNHYFRLKCSGNHILYGKFEQKLGVQGIEVMLRWEIELKQMSLRMWRSVTMHCILLHWIILHCYFIGGSHQKWGG